MPSMPPGPPPPRPDMGPADLGSPGLGPPDAGATFEEDDGGCSASAFPKVGATTSQLALLAIRRR